MYFYVHFFLLTKRAALSIFAYRYFVITRHGSMLVICYVITFHIFHLLISNNNIPSSNNRN